MKKTKIKFCLCIRCFNKIRAYGYPCILLIDLSCIHFLGGTPLTLDEKNSHDRSFKTALAFMERKGFLISSEIDETTIQIIPNTFRMHPEHDNKTFCWCDS